MNALVIIQLLTQYAEQIKSFGALLARAHAEGRDVTDAEIDAVHLETAAAIARLRTVIDAAKAAEPPAPTGEN